MTMTTEKSAVGLWLFSFNTIYILTFIQLRHISESKHVEIVSEKDLFPFLK